MLGVGAIALFLSTITDSALGAALGALAALITSEVLVTLNSASAVNPYLPTRYWLAWIDFFRDPIVWRNIERGFAVQGVYVWCSWPRPGRTSPPRTSPADRAAQAGPRLSRGQRQSDLVGRFTGRNRACRTIAVTAGLVGSWEWLSLTAGHTDWMGTLRAPGQPRGVRRGTVVSSVPPQGQPARTGRQGGRRPDAG